MPPDVKMLSGFMNTDDVGTIIPANHHSYANNVVFRGNGNNFQVQNANGTTHIINPYLPNGSNECLGSFFDGNKLRIFELIVNSSGRDGIFMYDINLGQWFPLLRCFTDSQTNILGFDLDFPIPSINIIYTTEQEGDIITWTARNKRPKQLNIKDALAGKFGVNWIEEYLDVAKAPAVSPIQCAYENDTTVIVNNLKNKQYHFKYRYIYGNNLKSTWSPQSILPIPFNYTNQTVDTDQTKNCRVGLIMQTGEADVIKIEIAACESLGNTFGDFFSVVILDKALLTIPNNDLYIWNFFNSEAYNYVDVAESILDFDRVPNLANTQELLNGNVLVYGGITEGYNPTVPAATIQIADARIQDINTSIGILCNQNGQTGLSTGDIKIALVGQVALQTIGGGQNSRIIVQIFNGATIDSLNVIATVTPTTIADMIALLITSATGLGYTIVSSTTNTVVVRKTNAVLYQYRIIGNGDQQKPVNLSVPVWVDAANYNIGIEYLDGKGKNCGTTTNVTFNTSTQVLDFPYTSAYIFYTSRIILSIFNRPPIYAESFNLVITNNLTKQKWLNWISDRTFKDAEFAYISIESIQTYKIINPTSIIGYDFATGDRIKFVLLFNPNKTINTQYGNTRDYEINSQVIDPDINGLVRKGQFVKIKLPPLSVNFDFSDGISPVFSYYYIELYTPAKAVANNLNVYYEFMQSFAIGNPGTALAYHQGLNQTQSTDLVTPATFELERGDAYYRIRDINNGAFFVVDSVAGIYTFNQEIMAQKVVINSTENNFETKDTIQATYVINQFNWLIHTFTVAKNFTIKGQVSFLAQNTTTHNLFIAMAVVNATTLVQDNLYNLTGFITGAVAGQIIKFNVDINVVIPAGHYAYIYLQESPITTIIFKGTLVQGQLKFYETDTLFSAGVIDENFSDFYASKVNSNGRPSIVQPDERETFYGTLLRWGLDYQQNTNINQINRFFPINFDEVDRSRGDIQRFLVEDRLLYLYQNRAVGNYGVLAKYIQNNSGESQLVTTNDILTKGNVNYLLGEYGLGDQYCGVARGKNCHSFIDPVRGYQVGRYGNGLIPISELHKGQFVIQPTFPPYNKTYLRPNGSRAKILMAYDFFEEEFLTVEQAGVLGSKSITALTYSFNKKREFFSSYFDFHPEWIMSAEDVVYSWLNGRMYAHTAQDDKYTTYYGTKYYPSITLFFNDKVALRKTFEALAYQANQYWVAPVNGDIVSSQPNPQTGMPQISSFKERDVTIQEGQYVVALLRDANSRLDAREALVNGDVLKGVWLSVRLTYFGNNYAYLYLPYVRWDMSNKNIR